MIPAVQPMIKTSYTERGNEYKESNIGKYAATATVAGAAVAYSGETAFKGAKEVFQKAKTIKLDLPKIKKPDFKTIKKPNIMTFIKNIPSKVSNLAHKSINLAKTGIDFVKTNAKKINFTKIKEAGKSAINFVTSNAKKINLSNIKNAGKAVAEFTKKTSFKYGAGIAAAFAGIIALGFIADGIANKISAKKADKA